MTENYIDHFLNHVLPELRIAVIGDIMVDRYVFGKVERISAEAPVPVNKVDHMTSVLGGAANGLEPGQSRLSRLFGRPHRRR